MIRKIKYKWDKYIAQLDKFLPFLIKHFQISDPHKLLGVKVTLQQYLALDTIAKKGKAMISELSKSLGVALSTMTELISRLEKKYLVRKEKDKLDRRVVWVRVTEEGLNLLKKMNIKKKRHIKAILEKLRSFERNALIRILDSISKITQKLEE